MNPGGRKRKIGLAGALLVCLLLGAALLIRATARSRLSAVHAVCGRMSAAETAELDCYPNLAELDLSDSECYEEILSYAAAHPDIALRYTVELGGTLAESDREELRLPEGAYSWELLRENLRYLPALRRVSLPRTGLSYAQIQELREAYPLLSVSYTVPLGERELAENTEELDLSRASERELAEAAGALERLPSLRRVILQGDEPSAIPLVTAARLRTAAPQAAFCYSFELFGQVFTLDEERLVFVDAEIGDEGVEELRSILPCLKNCRYLLLDNCGVSDEKAAQLREEFPRVDVVWRVFFGHFSCLTDVKVIHLTFGLTDQNAQVLRYCRDVEALDIGHNTLSDVSFISGMPKLTTLILSYNRMSDISALAACPELEIVELYYCPALSDFSPLAACPKLRLLNISWTQVRDITPALGMKSLERFYCIMNGIPPEQQEQLEQALPDCWCTFEQHIYKNVGWSFDEAHVRAPWYLDIYARFKYRVEDWYFGE